MALAIEVTIGARSTNRPHAVDFQHHARLKRAATPQAPGTRSGGHGPTRLHPGHGVSAIFVKMLQAHLAIRIVPEVQLTHSRQRGSLLAWLVARTHGLQSTIGEAQRTERLARRRHRVRIIGSRQQKKKMGRAQKEFWNILDCFD